jgi:ArsR family transcriptional regulator, arsenate/arsenite/antimonite-responsive transcriptional repressor
MPSLNGSNASNWRGECEKAALTAGNYIDTARYMDTKDALSAFDALSQPTRLAIFRLLIKVGEEGLPAGEIADAVNGVQNTVSTHLASLNRAGLIDSSREGRVIRYRANFAVAGDLVAFLLEDCCGGRAEICAPLVSNLSCLQPKAEACCD